MMRFTRIMQVCFLVNVGISTWDYGTTGMETVLSTWPTTLFYFCVSILLFLTQGMLERQIRF